MEFVQRKPNRIKEYDYSRVGAYFITVCTANREKLFWSCRRGELCSPDRISLSEMGAIVNHEIGRLDTAYEAVRVDKLRRSEPRVLHSVSFGYIFPYPPCLASARLRHLRKNLKQNHPLWSAMQFSHNDFLSSQGKTRRKYPSVFSRVFLPDWRKIVCENQSGFVSPQLKYCIMPDHIHMILVIDADADGRTQFAPTISRVIKQFKGAVTKRIGRSVWQRSFYDHVIRDRRDYDEIWEYIENNPMKLALME